MKLTADKIAFAALTIALMFRAVPTNASKAAGGLRLSPLSNAGLQQLSDGRQPRRHTRFPQRGRRRTWTPLVTGLSGASGTWFFHGFTLDRDYQYRIIAE